MFSLKRYSMPVITLTASELEMYPQIGEGSEGIVKNFLNTYAIKIYYNGLNLSKNKIKKLQTLSKLQDDSFCFPVGLFESFCLTHRGPINGLFTNIINHHSEYRDLEDLYYIIYKKSSVDTLKYLRKALIYLEKADQAMKRIHQKGVIVGDIHSSNIMINDNDEPIFIDTDNYSYGKFDFDYYPWRASLLGKAFECNPSKIDSDIYAFSCMAFNLLIPIFEIDCHKEFYQKLVELLDVKKEVKDGLELIFSDAEKKPYISEILPKINFSQTLLTEENIETLKTYK